MKASFLKVTGKASNGMTLAHGIAITPEETSQSKRNKCLNLLVGIDTVERVHVFETTPEGVKEVATFSPVDFTAFTGKWAVTWVEGITPARALSEDDTKRTDTKKYGKDKTATGLDLRVDVQQMIYAVDAAFHGTASESKALSGKSYTAFTNNLKTYAALLRYKVKGFSQAEYDIFAACTKENYAAQFDSLATKVASD